MRIKNKHEFQSSSKTTPSDRDDMTIEGTTIIKLADIRLNDITVENRGKEYEAMLGASSVDWWSVVLRTSEGAVASEQHVVAKSPSLPDKDETTTARHSNAAISFDSREIAERGVPALIDAAKACGAVDKPEPY